MLMYLGDLIFRGAGCLKEMWVRSMFLNKFLSTSECKIHSSEWCKFPCFGFLTIFFFFFGLRSGFLWLGQDSAFYPDNRDYLHSCVTILPNYFFLPSSSCQYNLYLSRRSHCHFLGCPWIIIFNPSVQLSLYIISCCVGLFYVLFRN